MISLKNRWARLAGLGPAAPPSSRFYELGVERHLGAQGACDPAAAHRARNAVARRQRALAVTAEICAAAREPAGGIGDRAPAGRRVGADFRVTCNSDAQQL
jgi:hypothetical protein